MQKNADFIHAICCHCILLTDDYKNEMLEMKRTNEWTSKRKNGVNYEYGHHETDISQQAR